MNLQFRATDYHSDIDCEALASWRNNPELQELWSPLKSNNRISVKQVREEGLEISPFSPVTDELAILGARIIGQLTLLVNPPHKRSKGERVLWPSIVIGENSLRGAGLVRRFWNRIEHIASELQASHIEAGVFEYNFEIRRLLEKSGFREIARLENRIKHMDQLWDEIRYELPMKYVLYNAENLKSD